MRLEADLEQRVRASVDGDEHRLEVPDVRTHDPEVSLVARPARDDDGVSVAEPRLQLREVDPVGEQLALVAQVAQRVVGERLERLGDAALLVGERSASVASVSSTPSARRVPLRHSEPLADGQRLTLGDLLEQVGPGRVDEAHAGADELERPGIRESDRSSTARR